MLASLPLPQKAKDERKLVVTYVSRQHAAKGRRLAVEDNARLEAALKALEPEFEVNLVYFEEHDRAEQIQIAARSDVGLRAIECKQAFGKVRLIRRDTSTRSKDLARPAW